MFAMRLHPAAEGDAITLAWGDPSAPWRALIDLGRAKTYEALAPKLAGARFELFVMTHIDADHIGGAMPFARKPKPDFDAREVWFNGYHHLAAAKARKPQVYETFSAQQGEKLSEAIRRLGWAARWNAAFAGGPVSVDSPAAREPIRLAGGLTIRLLSPSDAELVKLEAVWRSEIEKLGLRPDDPDRDAGARPGTESFSGAPDVAFLAQQPFVADESAPNGSSIAFLADYEGRRILLCGDAHPGRLAASLRALGASPASRMKIDAFKLPHHGSKANTSPELLSLIDCDLFAISTDGTKHNHPDPETLARLLAADRTRDKRLVFNVRQPRATLWDAAALQRDWRYQCVFPDVAEDGALVLL